MGEAAWMDQEALDLIAPALALKYTIQGQTALRPSAIMLPLTVLPRLESLGDIPVLRGDRVALVYEAPK